MIETDLNPKRAMKMHPHPDDHGHAKAVHNMALVGEHRIFLSHLPMFMPPHDAQVIVEATFVKDGKNVDDVYFADRASNPDIRFYTVQPESFAIQELFQPDPMHSRRTQFKAAVFRGHLEKGGTPVDPLQDIDVHIKRIVLARSFEGGDKLSTLKYILFGDDQERFLAHLISKAPDFDQILAVTGDLPPPGELERGVTAEVLGRPNLPSGRLKTQEVVPVRGHVTGAHQFLNLNITVQAELYFEEGELSSAKMSGKLFDQTKEEKKAGFE
jgi:hypothetical protein